MTDVTTINGKKYIKIVEPREESCCGCDLHIQETDMCAHPSLETGCFDPSIIYKEFVEPEEPTSLTKAEVIAAIYSETPLECCVDENGTSFFTPDFVLHPSKDLDKKVIVYLQNFQNNFVWRYKKVPKVLSVTTRKFLQRSHDDVVINIWSSNWATPQSEVMTTINSFIRWLEEPQTTTHEIEEI